MKTTLIDAGCITMVQKAIEYELDASQTYLALANQMQGLGYFGAQRFFLSESNDERAHYQRHVDFLNDLGVVAAVPALKAQAVKAATFRDAFALAMGRETDLLEFYRDMTKKLFPEYPEVFAHFMEFVGIQVKAVGEYGDLLARIDAVADDKCGLLIIDKEIG